MIVYLLTNRVNGKRYVGRTVRSLVKRWIEHQEKPRLHRSVIGRAIRLYGAQAFSVETLVTCQTFDEVNDAERFYIALLSSKVPAGYNVTLGGKGCLGFTASAETRAKQSARMLANGHVPPTRLGTTHSETTKFKIRAWGNGRPKPEGFGAKIAEANSRRIIGETTRLKRKLNALNMSAETKQKMSDSAKRRCAGAARNCNGQFLTREAVANG